MRIQEKLREDDIFIEVIGVDYDDYTEPSIKDYFKENEFYNFYDFIEICNDIQMAQKGHFNVYDNNGINFKVVFTTYRDDKEHRTGLVLFEVLVAPSKESLLIFQKYEG